MNYIKHQTGLFERFAADDRINTFHISLYFALFQMWNKNRFRNPFPIEREEIMHLAHIGSVNTYTRCIKQLHQWRYIDYFPSFHPTTGSKVSCISFDKADDKGGNNATDQARDQAESRAGDKGSNQAGDKALNKNLNSTNNSNSNKQDYLKNLNNGTGKKSTGRFHVNNDKDYSEPL